MHERQNIFQITCIKDKKGCPNPQDSPFIIYYHLFYSLHNLLEIHIIMLLIYSMVKEDYTYVI